MALKFNLKNISQDDIEEARKEFSAGRYEGPTPPPDLYNVKVTHLWSGENKAGATLTARLQLDNQGENSEYNGYSILHNMTIPDNPKDQFFAIRMKSLDDFFRAVSGGKMDVSDFVAAANAGKVISDKSEKMGDVITQIGKLKIANAKDITVKTKPPVQVGDKEYVNVHYIDTSKIDKLDDGDDDDYDDDVDNDDIDDDDDIDSMLEDMD